MRPIDSEERGGSLEAEARTLPEGTAGYNLRPLSNHPQAESSGSRRPSIEDNPAPDEDAVAMSLPPEMLQWMKDSHTATQEQIKQQAEEAKAAEQRSREALLAIEKRAEAAAELARTGTRSNADSYSRRRCRRSRSEHMKALKEVAKQGHASTAAVIAGMHTTGDGTAFKDLVKLEKTYTDPDVLRQFCLWENSAVDYMEAMGKKVLQTRRRALSKGNPNLAPGMSDYWR